MRRWKYSLRTTNELLLKERINLLSEQKIKVNELSKVMGNVLIPKNKVKGVTTRGGKMTSEATSSKEFNETRINKNEPPRFEQDVQEKLHDDGVENKSLSIPERTTQPLVKPQQSSIPFSNRVVTPNWTFEKRKRFFSQVNTYFWEEPYAFKLCSNNIMRRCVAGSETLKILAHYLSGPTGGHHSANVTAKKVYKSRLYWPSVIKDANEYVRRCDACQRSGNISSRNEMPQNNIQFNELAELRDGVYENTRIYKERTKKWHDSRLHGDKDFKVDDKVLLYNSHLKMYPGKLKLKWSGPNIVKTVYPYGVVEIIDKNGFNFKVNGQRLKKYYECNIDREDDVVIEFKNGVT
ncbi:reverse transcriptase domain-containing protein [Tanacetum coccineum]